MKEYPENCKIRNVIQKPYMIISRISSRGILEALRSESIQAKFSTSSWLRSRSNIGLTNWSHESYLLLVHVVLKNTVKIILLATIWILTFYLLSTHVGPSITKIGRILATFSFWRKILHLFLNKAKSPPFTKLRSL